MRSLAFFIIGFGLGFIYPYYETTKQMESVVMRSDSLLDVTFEFGCATASTIVHPETIDKRAEFTSECFEKGKEDLGTVHKLLRRK